MCHRKFSESEDASNVSSIDPYIYFLFYVVNSQVAYASIAEISRRKEPRVFHQWRQRNGRAGLNASTSPSIWFAS